MNKAFKERQYVGRLSSAGRRNAHKAVINEKRAMCEGAVKGCYRESCKDCNYGKSHCYCMAA